MVPCRVGHRHHGAVGERALERLTPVFSGFSGTEEDEPWGHVPPPAPDARAYRVSNPDPVAEARLAAGLEEIADVGVPAINAAIAERVSRAIELADEYALAGRLIARRAGARRHRRARAARRAGHPAHGLAAQPRGHRDHALGPGAARVHAATSDETLEMLRGAFVSYGSAASY